MEIITREIESADGWEVSTCPHSQTSLLLLDDDDMPFAQAHIGDEADVNHLILALLASGDKCLQCIVERLEALLMKVRNELSAPLAHVPAQVAAGSPA